MKNKNYSYEDDDYDYEYEDRKKAKKADLENQKRRNIRNWKKAWSEHTDDFDEIDDFYAKSHKA